MTVTTRLGAIALVLLCTTRAHAQLGALRKLPGGVGDAARAAEMMKQANEAKRTPSPLAGTYRLVYVFGPPGQTTDSIILYARTFEKPSTGTVGGDFAAAGKASDGSMTQGYMLTLVAGATLDGLPSTPELAEQTRSSNGGGFALVYPFAGDSLSARAFSADWVVLLPKKTSAENDAFNKRVDRARSGGLVSADGSGKPRSVNQITLSEASTVLLPDKSIRVRYALRKGDEVVTVRGERISLERYPSP